MPCATESHHRPAASLVSGSLGTLVRRDGPLDVGSEIVRLARLAAALHATQAGMARLDPDAAPPAFETGDPQ